MYYFLKLNQLKKNQESTLVQKGYSSSVMRDISRRVLNRETLIIRRLTNRRGAKHHNVG